jgi:hypothetical protein
MLELPETMENAFKNGLEDTREFHGNSDKSEFQGFKVSMFQRFISLLQKAY